MLSSLVLFTISCQPCWSTILKQLGIFVIVIIFSATLFAIMFKNIYWNTYNRIVNFLPNQFSIQSSSPNWRVSGNQCTSQNISSKIKRWPMQIKEAKQIQLYHLRKNMDCIYEPQDYKCLMHSPYQLTIVRKVMHATVTKIQLRMHTTRR